LKTRYRDGHQDCSLHIEESQWNRLVEYLEADATMEKSKKMSKARDSVKVLSTLGKNGKAGREAEEVQITVMLQSCYSHICT
jgi:hypothetical protein